MVSKKKHTDGAPPYEGAKGGDKTAEAPEAAATGTPIASNSEADEAVAERQASDLTVVGIGASAGGLNAFKGFFSAMPADSGMGFVLVPHLDPTHESLMVELLTKHTDMPVCEAKDGVAIGPNRVYVIPPNRYLAVSGRALRLSDPAAPRGHQTAIDHFLQSLGDELQERAIGIILSGTGSHGTPGLQAIKAAGGMTMVQDPDTAEYDSMPQSAIGSGDVDYVLPVEAMPAALIKYIQHAYVNGSTLR